MAAAAALVAGGGAIALAGGGADRDAIGVLILAALVSTAAAVYLLGAPLARPGKPSRSQIAFLFAVGAAGAVLTVVVAPVVALGVVYVSYTTMSLALRRYPPAEWLALPPGDRAGRIPVGAAVAAAGTLPFLLGVVAAAERATDSRAARYAVVVVAAGTLAGWWIRIALRYAGRLAPAHEVRRPTVRRNGPRR